MLYFPPAVGQVLKSIKIIAVSNNSLVKISFHSLPWCSFKAFQFCTSPTHIKFTTVSSTNYGGGSGGGTVVAVRVVGVTITLATKAQALRVTAAPPVKIPVLKSPNIHRNRKTTELHL